MIFCFNQQLRSLEIGNVTCCVSGEGIPSKAYFLSVEILRHVSAASLSINDSFNFRDDYQSCVQFTEHVICAQYGQGLSHTANTFLFCYPPCFLFMWRHSLSSLNNRVVTVILFQAFTEQQLIVYKKAYWDCSLS